MKLFEDHSYFIFPGYGSEFRDMEPWLDQWKRVFRGEHQFWHGFNGGGILAVPNAIPLQERYLSATDDGHFGLKAVYGMVLGNEAGKTLTNYVCCVQQDRPPAFAVKFGAEQVPDPTVTMTPEHLGSLGTDRILLVVPRIKRRSLKHLEQLPEWFDAFGVCVDNSPCDVSEVLGDEMPQWFTDPSRTIFGFRMSGGEDNAAWQTAVAYYVAEYWDTQVRGLQSIHVVANIEGEPCFRKNWTSNK